jgi:hypothetical protein
MGTSPVTGKPRFERGPITYQCYATVLYGQLVKFGTSGNSGLIAPAGAGDICIGVATTNGLPVGTANTGTSLAGFPLIEAGMPDENVAVARRGVYALNAAGTIAPGAFVKAGAAGAVVAWVDGTDSTTLRVGQCIDAAGGVNAGTVLVDLCIG